MSGHGGMTAILLNKTRRMMMDWKKMTDAELIGSFDFEKGEEKIFTITDVSGGTVFSDKGKSNKKPIATLAETKLKMVLNSTNCKTLSKLYNSRDTDSWIGKKIQVYVDPNVKFGGEIKDGLRIRPFVPKPASQSQQSGPVCADCGEPVAEYQGITAAQLAAATNKKYGRPLCYGCSVEAKKQTDPLGGEQIATQS
jgi:hypothetical protein